MSPCNSDYMNPTEHEKNHSDVRYLLEELETGNLSDKYGRGFHPDVYNKRTTENDLKSDIELLCSKLQGKDVSSNSLELQMWWRNHQRADQERIKREMFKLKTDKARDEALSKLTDYEREILGF